MPSTKPSPQERETLLDAARKALKRFGRVIGDEALGAVNR